MEPTQRGGDASRCLSCGTGIVPLDMSLTMKFVDRAARRYYCKRCLAREMNTTEAQLDEMAAFFRARHCALFT